MVIKGFDPAIHMGEWSCSVEAWNDKVQAKIMVKKPTPSVVEFLNMWQDAVVNIGKLKDEY